MNIEWAVKWESIGPRWPEEVHAKASEADAREALRKSACPGLVVWRPVGEWEPAA